MADRYQFVYRCSFCGKLAAGPTLHEAPAGFVLNLPEQAGRNLTPYFHLPEKIQHNCTELTKGLAVLVGATKSPST